MSELMMDDLYKKIIQNKLGTPSSIKGCSQKEIDLIEEKFKCKLPETYKNFLKRFGKSAGDLFKGTDCFYQDIFELKAMAEELLLEDGGECALPPESFVFSVHQGYQFMFFRLNSDKNDPPIFYYMETSKEFIKKYESFSDFLNISVDEYIKFRL